MHTLALGLFIGGFSDIGAYKYFVQTDFFMPEQLLK